MSRLRRAIWISIGLIGGRGRLAGSWEVLVIAP